MGMGISKDIVEGNSQIVIKSMLGQSQASKLIRNLIEDIRLVKYFMKIFFCHYNKRANTLPDSLAKKVHLSLSTINLH